MKIFKTGESKTEKYLQRLQGRLSEVLSSSLHEKVRRICHDVAKRGDRALVAYVQRFDLKGLPQSKLEVTGETLGVDNVEAEFVAAVELAIANLRSFHEPQMPKGYVLDSEQVELGIRVRPLESVGVYVPGGAAVYLSSLLMAVIPAQVAGVARIAVATPPRAFLTSPYLRYVLKRLDLNEVYLMGGAHGIAALAFGTESVVAVDKIVGPGGRYVTAAKRAVFGYVDIDMLAGPSELVILAEANAEAEIVVADLLAQAEHDPDAVAVVVTPSKALAEKVDRMMSSRLRRMKSDAPVRRAIKEWGGIVVVRDLDEGLEVVNRIAPEHLEILVEDPRRLVDGIENAGAIYLGPWSANVLGDYVVGTNHVLPTAGAARFSSPLGVWDFVKRTAIVRVAPHAYPKLAVAAHTLATCEKLPLHAEALVAGRRGRM